MGSPADWGAFADVCARGADVPAPSRCEDGGLPEDVSDQLRSRMLGRRVRVHVEHSLDEPRPGLADRLVLTSLEARSETLSLAPGSSVRQTRLSLSSRLALQADGAWEGQLVAASGTRGKLGCLSLLFQQPPLGPFLERLLLQRRSLRQAFPELVADQIITFLSGAWDVLPLHEVVASTEDAVGGPRWPSMMWWPLQLQDWKVVSAPQAPSGSRSSLQG